MSHGHLRAPGESLIGCCDHIQHPSAPSTPTLVLLCPSASCCHFRYSLGIKLMYLCIFTEERLRPCVCVCVMSDTAIQAHLGPQNVFGETESQHMGPLHTYRSGPLSIYSSRVQVAEESEKQDGNLTQR